MKYRRRRRRKRKRTTQDLERFANKLRRRMTRSEQRIWNLLKVRQNGTDVNFEPQQVVGWYIADFIERELMLVVEIDGGYHNGRRQRRKDARRTTTLITLGFRVVRYTNDEVDASLSEIVDEMIAGCPE